MAVAGAGVLAFALVIAPPAPAAAQTPSGPVHPTVLAFSPTAAMAALQRIVDASPQPVAVPTIQVPTTQPAGRDGHKVGDVAPLTAAALAVPGLSLPTPNELFGMLVTPLLENPVIGPVIGQVLLGGLILTVGALAVVFAVCPPCGLVYDVVVDLVRNFFTRVAPFRVAAAAVAEPVEMLAEVEPAQAEPDETMGRLSEPPEDPVLQQDSPVGDHRALGEQAPPDVPQAGEDEPLTPSTGQEEIGEISDEGLAQDDTEDLSPTEDEAEAEDDVTGDRLSETGGLAEEPESDAGAADDDATAPADDNPSDSPDNESSGGETDSE
ncbi:hypothetical protein BHQ18_11105 [Mycolicibacterium flavescens]|uniref:Transmembrane protein n=1 Tax=Mycolicibacterium flavescens TaxID=1776 RepID=A0A1E3RKP8_MYCFV|nr:hypothetical protein BHQ18_11105 [Mycolicibacterium flavescens]